MTLLNNSFHNRPIKAQSSSPPPLAAWGHGAVQMEMLLACMDYSWRSAAPATPWEAVFAGQQRAASTVVRAVPVGRDWAGPGQTQVSVAATAGSCVNAAGD